MITKINAKTIAIEGADCVGKETHAKLLAEKLNAEYVAFPRYGHPMSYPIKKWLNREYDSALMSYIYISSIYYADMIDFQATGRDTFNFDSKDQIIVFDRLIFSNLIYQSMYGINSIDDRNRITIISRMGKIFELGLEMGLLVPDHTIILTGSEENLKFKENKDKNESNEFQKRVHKNLNNFIEWIKTVYRYHPACKGKTYEVINTCNYITGKMNSIEDNQKRILHSVENASRKWR